MIIRFRYLVPLFLAVIFIIAGTPAILNPLLYEKTAGESTTFFHFDPSLYQGVSENATETGLSGMQDLIDASGPLTLSIKVKDPETAMRDLRRYWGAIEHMDQLVVTFEMSESELETYLQEHEENAQILEDLLAETSRYDQLKSMEVQFASRDDPEQLISVIMEKGAIRDRVKQMLTEYKSHGVSIQSTAKKYVLDSTEYIQSEHDFENIVLEIEKDQNIAENNVKRLSEDERNEEFLSIFVEPYEVTYGDVLRIWGVNRIKGGANRSVEIYLDDGQAGTSSVANEGLYEFYYPVERLNAGLHSVYAEDGIRHSKIVTFRLTEVSSEIMLWTDLPDADGVTCYGELFTVEERGVKEALVELTWDGSHTVTTETDEQGAYEVRLTLPEGRHTLQARFSGEGFPVGPSVSEEVTVDVPRDLSADNGSFDLISLLVAGGIMLTSGVGAVFYLRRRKPMPVPRGPEPEVSLPEAVTDLAVPAGEETPARLPGLFDLFVRVLGMLGLREAAFAVYREFSTRVARALGISRVKALTPRELAARTAGKHFSESFRSFVPHYEVVRYGPDPESEKEALISAIKPLDLDPGGGEED